MFQSTVQWESRTLSVRIVFFFKWLELPPAVCQSVRAPSCGRVTASLGVWSGRAVGPVRRVRAGLFRRPRGQRWRREIWREKSWSSCPAQASVRLMPAAHGRSLEETQTVKKHTDSHNKLNTHTEDATLCQIQSCGHVCATTTTKAKCWR